ncbi:MAG: phosphoribosylanthranilate isomerase [Acidobacteriaceae bacterium]|nr:phosphoribosylanthranilate isomerase [Acidobacteriaceae bacterium]MBV9296625.1 phosphoribosylanthranilate isomerase [Acidobacteriaceae bacterium]MBV9765226.1 phosphoribosylanthranilate isomerase [Acidobacteriaceae bacterium]
MLIIKICGITNEEDARIAIEAGANALGFNFHPASPRYIDPRRAREIIRVIPGSFLKVGVFVDLSEDAVNQTPLDVLQIHGSGRTNGHHRIWRAIQPGDPIQDPDAEAYLMDAAAEGSGGSGKTFNWKLAAGSPVPIIIAGGLDGTNVAEAIRIAQPRGVDACSRLESSPGKKDPRRVREFVQAALEASRLPQETAP